MSILQRVIVTKIGLGGGLMAFHPSHDMGALFCRGCGAWGFALRSNTDRRKANRLCPAVRQSGIGL